MAKKDVVHTDAAGMAELTWPRLKMLSNVQVSELNELFVPGGMIQC